MNDTQTIEALLAETHWVRRLASSLVRTEADAEDLAQETLALALRRPPAPGRPVRPWLATVARNLARTARRGAANRAAREGEARPPRREGLAPEELLQELELQEELSALVRGLRAEERDAVVLRYHEGLTAAEIGRRLGVPPATVRSRLKRGLEHLRGELDTRWDGDRRAWISALTPLAEPFAPARAVAAVGASALFWVSVWTSIAAAGVTAVLVGTGALEFGSGESPPPVVSPRTAGTPETVADGPGIAVAGPDERVAGSAPTAALPADEDRAPAAALESAVRLRVIDGAGGPVAGAVVEIVPDGRASAAAAELFESMAPLEREAALAGLTGKTGADGRIELRSDLLRIDAVLTLDVRGERNAGTSLSVEIEPGMTVDAGEVTLVPRVRFTGALVDERGEDLAGKVGAFSPDGLALEPIAETIVDAGRPFDLYVGEEGTFVLRGRALDATAWSERFTEVSARLGDTFEATVAAPSVASKIVVTAQGETGEPIVARVTYRLQRDGRDLRSGMTMTDALGVAELSMPLAGSDRLVLEVSPQTGLHAPLRRDLVPPYADVELRFEAVATVQRVLRLLTPDGERPTGRSLARAFGAYSPAALDGSELRVDVPTDAAADYLLRLEVDGMVPISRSQAELLAASETSEIALVPLPGIRGVVLADGAPVARAALRVSHRCDPGEWSRSRNGISGVRWGSGHDDETDTEGRIRMPLAYEGQWVLEVSAPGWAPAVVDLGDFDPAAGVSGLEVNLVRPGQIAGTVTDADGAPVQRALVVALHPLHRTVRARTRQNGTYALSLAPGEWTIFTPATVEAEHGRLVGLSVPDGWTLPGGTNVAAGASVRLDLGPLPTVPVALAIRVDGAPPSGGSVHAHLEHGDPLLEWEGAEATLGPDGKALLKLPADRRCVLRATVPGLDGALVRTAASGGELATEPAWEIETARLVLEGAPRAQCVLRIVHGETTQRLPVTLDDEGRSRGTVVVRGRAEAFLDGAWVEIGSIVAEDAALRLP